MTNLNKVTQKAKRWIDSYFNSTCYSVLDFYSRPSQNKIYIEQRIRDNMNNDGYHDYRILGGNSSFYTCGYRTLDNKKLIIETAYNTFVIEL